MRCDAHARGGRQAAEHCIDFSAKQLFALLVYRARAFFQRALAIIFACFILSSFDALRQRRMPSSVAAALFIVVILTYRYYPVNLFS